MTQQPRTPGTEAGGSWDSADAEVQRKLDELWAEAQRSQAVGEVEPMRYGNGIEYAVMAIRRVLADHPVPDWTWPVDERGQAREPDRDAAVERIAAVLAESWQAEMLYDAGLRATPSVTEEKRPRWSPLG